MVYLISKEMLCKLQCLNTCSSHFALRSTRLCNAFIYMDFDSTDSNKVCVATAIKSFSPFLLGLSSSLICRSFGYSTQLSPLNLTKDGHNYKHNTNAGIKSLCILTLHQIMVQKGRYSSRDGRKMKDLKHQGQRGEEESRSIRRRGQRRATRARR